MVKTQPEPGTSRTLRKPWFASTLRRAIAIWPDYAEAHNNLGTARVDQGRTDDAIREFAEAVRIKPSDPMFRYNLAAVLQSSGRTSEALHEIQMALRLKPGDPTLLGALAVISDTLHR